MGLGLARRKLAAGVVGLMLCATACGQPADQVASAESATSLGEAPDFLPQVDHGDLAIELRDAAVDALEIPEPEIAVESVAQTDGEDQIHLRVDNPWETIEVQAKAANPEATLVRIFATPVRTEWAMGDGETLVCVHSEAGVSDDGCTYTYAADGVYDGTGSITWGLSWSVDDEYRGVFSTVASTAPFVVSQVG